MKRGRRGSPSGYLSACIAHDTKRLDAYYSARDALASGTTHLLSPRNAREHKHGVHTRTVPKLDVRVDAIAHHHRSSSIEVRHHGRHGIHHPLVGFSYNYFWRSDVTKETSEQGYRPRTLSPHSRASSHRSVVKDTICTIVPPPGSSRPSWMGSVLSLPHPLTSHPETCARQHLSDAHVHPRAHANPHTRTPQGTHPFVATKRHPGT
jgi:hypothetical protein